MTWIPHCNNSPADVTLPKTNYHIICRTTATTPRRSSRTGRIYVLNLLPKLEMVCWDVTITGNLFHSTSAAVAKLHLSIAFLGWIEETDSLFI